MRRLSALSNGQIMEGKEKINGYCWSGKEQKGAFSSKCWGATQTEEIQDCWLHIIAGINSCSISSCY